MRCDDDSDHCCEGVQCCGKDNICCGESCCDTVGSTCCNANCCEPDHSCCSGENCCEPGNHCCGSGCCEPSRPKCCGNGCCETTDVCCGDNCCAAGSSCCDGECCAAGSYCTPNGNCCPNGQTECGRFCCNAGEQCCTISAGNLQCISGGCPSRPHGRGWPLSPALTWVTGLVSGRNSPGFAVPSATPATPGGLGASPVPDAPCPIQPMHWATAVPLQLSGELPVTVLRPGTITVPSSL